MKYFLMFVFLANLSGCGTLYSLPPDGAWYSVAAIQAVDASGKERTQRLDLTSLKQSGISECSDIEKIDVSVRVIEIKPFNDYSKLPEKLAPSNGSPPEFSDTGPLDMTLARAWRVVTIGTGYELLARAKKPCAVLRVKKID